MSSVFQKIKPTCKAFANRLTHLFGVTFMPKRFNSITRMIRTYHTNENDVSLELYNRIIQIKHSKHLHLSPNITIFVLYLNPSTMSIQYEFYRNPNSQGTNKKRYHARVVPAGRISTDQLAEEIQKESSLTVADVKSVLIALADKLGEHLGEGRKVHLEGIGYFQVNLQCKEEVRTMHAVRSENIEFKSVSFRADNDLKKTLKEQKIQRSRLKPHSMPMTEQQIDMKLTEHFAQKPIITRREFQILCLQVKPTACRILRKLVEEGKLRNISTQQNPVYVPDNGHYAPVQGE